MIVLTSSYIDNAYDIIKSRRNTIAVPRPRVRNV